MEYGVLREQLFVVVALIQKLSSWPLPRCAMCHASACCWNWAELRDSAGWHLPRAWLPLPSEHSIPVAREVLLPKTTVGEHKICPAEQVSTSRCRQGWARGKGHCLFLTTWASNESCSPFILFASLTSAGGLIRCQCRFGH